MYSKNEYDNDYEHDDYGDGDIPPVDTDYYKNVEPLPESFRERRDGPGGD